MLELHNLARAHEHWYHVAVGHCLYYSAILFKYMCQIKCPSQESSAFEVAATVTVHYLGLFEIFRKSRDTVKTWFYLVFWQKIEKNSPCMISWGSIGIVSA